VPKGNQGETNSEMLRINGIRTNFYGTLYSSCPAGTPAEWEKLHQVAAQLQSYGPKREQTHQLLSHLTKESDLCADVIDLVRSYCFDPDWLFLMSRVFHWNYQRYNHDKSVRLGGVSLKLECVSTTEAWEKFVPAALVEACGYKLTQGPLKLRPYRCRLEFTAKNGELHITILATHRKTGNPILMKTVTLQLCDQIRVCYIE